MQSSRQTWSSTWTQEKRENEENETQKRLVLSKTKKPKEVRSVFGKTWRTACFRKRGAQTSPLGHQDLPAQRSTCCHFLPAHLHFRCRLCHIPSASHYCPETWTEIKRFWLNWLNMHPSQNIQQASPVEITLPKGYKISQQQNSLSNLYHVIYHFHHHWSNPNHLRSCLDHHKPPSHIPTNSLLALTKPFCPQNTSVIP